MSSDKTVPNTLETFDNLISVEAKEVATLEDHGVEVSDANNDVKNHWVGMPEFVNEAKKTYKTLNLHFRNKEDYEAFARLIEQPLTEKSKAIWYPALNNEQNSLLRWVEDEDEQS